MYRYREPDKRGTLPPTRMTTKQLDDLDDHMDLDLVARGAIVEHMQRGSGGPCTGTASQTKGVHFHQPVPSSGRCSKRQ